MIFATRQAAWCNAILSAHLTKQGESICYADVQGAAYVRRWGKTYRFELQTSGDIQVREVNEAPAPKQDRRVYLSASQFQLQENPQHDAWDDSRQTRFDAFGVPIDTPTVEGYDRWGPIDTFEKARNVLRDLTKVKAKNDADRLAFNRAQNLKMVRGW